MSHLLIVKRLPIIQQIDHQTGLLPNCMLRLCLYLITDACNKCRCSAGSANSFWPARSCCVNVEHPADSIPGAFLARTQICLIGCRQDTADKSCAAKSSCCLQCILNMEPWLMPGVQIHTRWRGSGAYAPACYAWRIGCELSLAADISCQDLGHSSCSCRCHQASKC